jgi:hypothetical protein
VYLFPEKGEAAASIDSVGSLRVDVVTELKETGSGVMVSASKWEGKVTQTSVLTRATQHNIPEDTILHSHRRENLKSYYSIYLEISLVYDGI